MATKIVGKTIKLANANMFICLPQFFRMMVCHVVFWCLSYLPIGLVAQATLPSLKPDRVRSYDVEHIALDLRFDFQKKQAYGTARIDLAPLIPLEEIALDAAFMQIDKVELGGQTLKFDYVDGDKDGNLSLKLERKFAVGEKISVLIQYRTLHQNKSDPNSLGGSSGKGLRFFEPTTTEPRKRRQIWSIGTPYGNRYWFPCYDAPNDLRACELRLHVPKPLMAISVGKLLEKKSNSDGTETFRWQMDQPHANHQTAIVIGEYLPLKQLADETQLISYAYPDEVEATKVSVVRLADMVQYFEKVTGHAYPYESYQQVFVQDFLWGGGDHVGFSTISENMVDDFGTHADFFYLWDGVEAQDLVSQWFGNLLTPSDWSEVWLNKSFAFYFDCLYTEQKNGHDEMQLWNRNYQINTCQWDWQSGVKRPIVTRNYADAEVLCNDNFALRGALVLHLLRQELGEEIWTKAIRNYVNQHASKLVTTLDFQRAVETAAQRPMAWFFEQWVYRVGQPSFEVTKSYDAKNGALTLIVKQLQTLDSVCAYPQTEYFQGRIAIEVDGQLSFHTLLAQRENVLTIPTKNSPRWVHFDVGSAWLKDLKFEKQFDELIAQYRYSTDALARRSAMFELSSFYKAAHATEAEQEQIIAALRAVIISDAYWRVRYMSILALHGLIGGKPLDKETEKVLLHVIKNEGSWNRAAALSFLGSTNDAKYVKHYIEQFKHESDRVVNAAANALGKCKAPGAYEALVELQHKPSWKNQSLISTLNGLRELGDIRGAELALKALRDEPAGARWFLATSTWDYRLAAAETLVTLGKGAEGYPIVHERLIKSVEEDDINDIFSNILLMVTLRDKRALELFPGLRERFKDDVNALKALVGYEEQLKEG